MHAHAWKTGHGEYRYKLQINHITGKRNFRRLVKEWVSKAWEVVGDGYGKEEGEFVLILAKSFSTEEEWLQEARQFELDVVEYNSLGRPKRHKLGINYRPRKKKING